ncbi:MAG: hypothetical protein ACO1NM_08225 [Sphingobium phenoxybenzoativorans]|uniref:hypothetical protein n=1 Tax=Sphingobium phenoxybenzoativorans TaxID=1592790 RepID=UPI00087217AD|nr:hypothetical protein [Sphingobium phenoxybenzoativorans]
MYDFIDRQVSELDEGGRFLLWSVRFWVRAIGQRRCPSTDIASAFERHGLAEALPHFNMTMLILNRHALNNMGFGPLACPRVHEAEALLLGILSRMRQNDETDLRNTLALTVEPQWVNPLSAAMSALAIDLAEVAFLPHAPAPLTLPTGGKP